ncbi:Hypothetical predicted protein [Marmota monax]|uniref:Uncharacterized protein n=2 Tax=Marmota monax TaxID=9995 RepID=A0A5E4AD39_MARMO|nr:hypothetical protein GHT09_000735 [Marmota monax]VTJ55078.1 Hypothetical predicted protein [Marmota monax]
MSSSASRGHWRDVEPSGSERKQDSVLFTTYSTPWRRQDGWMMDGWMDGRLPNSQVVTDGTWWCGCPEDFGNAPHVLSCFLSGVAHHGLFTAEAKGEDRQGGQRGRSQSLCRTAFGLSTVED